MTIEELKVVITAVTDGLHAGVQDAKRQINSLSNVSNNVAGEISTNLEHAFKEASLSVGNLKRELNSLSSTDIDFRIDAVKNEIKDDEEVIAKLTDRLKEAQSQLKKYQDILKESAAIQATWSEWEIPDVESRLKDLFGDSYTEAQKLQATVDRLNNIIRLNNIELEQSKQSLKLLTDRTKELSKQASSDKPVKQLKAARSEINGILAIAKRTLIRRAINAIMNQVRECIDLLAQFDSSLDNKLGTNKALSDLTSAFKKLSANIAAVAGQILTNLAPAIQVVVQILNAIIPIFTAIGAILNGKTTYSVANPDYWKDYAKALEDSSKAQKQLIGGFDELNVYSSTTSYSDINPDDLYKTVELQGIWKSIAEFIGKIRDTSKYLFGDEWGDALVSILEIVGGLKLAKAATDLLKNAFSKKNKVLKTQNGLEGDAATQLSSVLVPAFVAAGAAAGSFAKDLKNLPESLPALEPQVSLQPAYAALDELSSTIESYEAPTIEPQVSSAGIETWFAEAQELFDGYKPPEIKITPVLENHLALTALSELVTTIKEKAKEATNAFSEWGTNVVQDTKNSFSTIKSTISTWKENFITTINSTYREYRKRLNEYVTSVNADLRTSVINIKEAAIESVNTVRAKLSLIPTKVTEVKNKTLSDITALKTQFSTWMVSVPVTVDNVKNKVSSSATALYQTVSTKVSTFINTTKTNFAAWSSNVQSNIATAFTNAYNNISNWCTTTALNIYNWADNAVNNVKTATTNITSNVSTWCTNTASSIYKWAGNTANNVKAATTNIASNVYSGFSNAGKNISSWVTTSSSNVAKWASNASSNISKFCSNMVSNIRSAVQSGLSWLSKVFTGVSTWVGNNSAAIGAGIAAAGVAAIGLALAPYTGGASLGLMAFANGGVVDKPTNALIGEYPGAKTNPEIITPESKMREVFSETNGELVSAFAQMTRQVITAINNVDMEVTIGDDVIAKSAARGNKSYKRITGNALI